ncbi:MAG: beta-N-acetylhexosaminidase [Beijerinckiaceae bacterium]
MPETRAFTCGCAGLTFTQDEKDFIRRFRPWGLILFGRNVQNRSQLFAITSEFREIVGREDAPVLIDQEGGRVRRMKEPEWRPHPAAAVFDTLHCGDDEKAQLVRDGARLIAHDLAEVGINVDCMPVLDVPVEGANEVIGSRAYSADPEQAARLGRAACEGLLMGGVLPVIKHIPGHGRANADSHLALPVVQTPRAELERTDFGPFRALADMPMAMSAHVVYASIDPERPATVSPKVVSEVMRGFIGFDGLIMSDDLSMKALGGSFTEKTQALFAAGLDLALYCWSDLKEAAEVAEAAPLLDGRSAERAEKALDRLRTARREAVAFDPVDAAARQQSALAMPG